MKILTNADGKILATKMNVLRLIEHRLLGEKEVQRAGATRWLRYKAGCRFQGLTRARRDIMSNLGGKRGRVKKTALIARLKKTICWYRTFDVDKAVRSEALARLAVQKVLDAVQ